ncbi:MAG: phosphotransferase [Caldilineaceae bacterium]
MLYFAHYHAPLGRSVMVTTEIPGQALGYGERHPQHKLILRDAGRDLAQTGRINVVGFGWIDRSAAEVDMLRAEHASFAAWIEPEMAQACATLRRAALLTNPDLNNVRALTGMLIDMVGDKQAVLAHGDFDGTHIYQQAGVYSGIIDFGEIRGPICSMTSAIFRWKTRICCRICLLDTKKFARCPVTLCKKFG